jgi:hypothetical protein
MCASVKLAFRYTENDYARGLRLHYANTLHPKRDGVISIVMAVVGAYFWLTTEPRWIGITLTAVSGLLILLLLAAFFVIPKLVFRREPKFRDDYSLTFSTEGVHFQTAHIDSNLKWEIYTHVLTDSKSYILYYGKASFTIIPKRAFESVSQQQSFEELLAKFVLLRTDKP